LHPSFPYLSKQCTESVELNYTENRRILIEKGTNIFIPLFQIQTDAEYFPRPKEFLPERFDKQFGGEKVHRDKGVYLPFGNGSRLCIGMKLALIICKSAVVNVVRNFKVTVNGRTSGNVEFDPKSLFNKKKDGIWLDFKETRTMFKL
jgi:cytochrome P450